MRDGRLGSREQITYGDSAQATSFAESDTGLRGAEILVRCLLSQGVKEVFGYPGGANLEIFHVLARNGISCIRTEHEQGAAHAAQGYARASGRIGVCLATSGPGATNLVTGIADANSDSIPIVAITGNVPTHLLGKNAFQEVDITAIVAPITKGCFQIREVDDIPQIVRHAFTLAGSGRPGPVLIDVPKDVQQRVSSKPIPEAEGPTDRFPQALPLALSADELSRCQEFLAGARRPVIYAGGGIISSDTREALVGLAEALRAPVVVTIMGLGGFPVDHRLYFDVLGMHGAQYANVAVNEADVVLALGVRFDDRVTGNPLQFIEHGKIIHIDIDRAELHKNKPVTLAIRADLASALRQLGEVVRPCDSAAWLDRLRELKRRFPLQRSSVPKATEGLEGPCVIARLSELTRGDAIITTGVGQHQMWAMQQYRVTRPRSFISSSGFGTMGYGLPAAIGAKRASPDRTVIDIDGDGSLNMTIHELSTCHRYGIGVKVVVINNQWLGMVRQWQDMIYGGHRADSDLSDPTAVTRPGENAIYPDFVTIASGYRVQAARVTRSCELDAAFERLLRDPDEPYLLDLLVDREENVYPMIPAGSTYRDVIVE